MTRRVERARSFDPEQERRDEAREALVAVRRVHLRVLRADQTPGLSGCDDEDIEAADEEGEETVEDTEEEENSTDEADHRASDAPLQVGAAEDAEGTGRKPRVRGSTLSIKRLSKRELERGRMLFPSETTTALYDRPQRRADCLHGAHVMRPCPFVSCKHHLYLDVNKETGSIKVNFPDVEVWDMQETCTLDVADRGGLTLEEVGDIMNLTRERIRQLETRVVAKLQRVAELGRRLHEEGGAATSAGNTPVGKAAMEFADAIGAIHRQDDAEPSARSLVRVRQVRVPGV